MPIYYRGAGTGTYWNLNDATALGFQPRDPGITPSTTRIIQHVAQGLTLSPYISLTRSHPVALHYALETGTNQPTVHAPAYVYEIEINGPSSGFTLIDPLKEIAAAAVGPFDPVGYQHDGYPTVLLGVVSSLMAFFLHLPIPQSTAGGIGVRYATVSPFIWGLAASLRDAEILAVGNIPRNCVIRRTAVY